MKPPGSGIEPDTRDLPSSDPLPDPSGGIPQLAGELRYGHKALSGIRASLTSYWNERKAHETGVLPISSGYTLGFWRGREERCQAQFL
jgi:hypothetical protein